jgi:5-methyltetrahydropteroyltriglutamate--homocysteine methyltransferase
MSVLTLLDGKHVQIGVIDVAIDTIETPQEIAAVINEAAKYVPAQNIIAGTNCGMAPMRREIAAMKLEALGWGAALAREKQN